MCRNKTRCECTDVSDDAIKNGCRNESDGLYEGGFCYLSPEDDRDTESDKKLRVTTKPANYHRALGCVVKYLIASGTDKKFCGAFVFATQNSLISFSFKLFLIKLSKPKLATK
jgi:hypothetical protein